MAKKPKRVRAQGKRQSGGAKTKAGASGKAKKLKKLPKDTELGNNRNAFPGGIRLWQNDPRTGRPKWKIF